MPFKKKIILFAGYLRVIVTDKDGKTDTCLQKVYLTRVSLLSQSQSQSQSQRNG